eukprot:GEMP01021970.1.p1 GENE.GEMP01021970.1~~GEMP01021970.1.p1  ORF type:complete len:532 (+),score=96.71 GEMP01021970.1:144-1739(+)
MPRPSVSFESQYFVEYETGEGTFGRVRVVKDKQTGEKRNAKTVTKVNRTLDLLHVRKQLKALEQISHPHICTLKKFIECDSEFHLISEHLEGGELHDFLERIAVPGRNWLEERTVALYTQQILMATAYMHTQGVLHGELKPTSILLTSKLPDAQVRVTDFGVAQIFDPASITIRMRPSCFMPPELIELSSMDEITEKTDTWSIGVITYTMLVNCLPFSTLLHPKELARALNGKPKFFIDDGWAERTVLSRDFIRSLLVKAPKRLTAAQALSHEWIRSFATEHYSIPPNLDASRRPCVSKKRPDQKTIITCGLLIAAALIPAAVFKSHEQAFLGLDDNKDGFILVGEAEQLWSREAIKWTREDVKRMLSYVALTGIVDISTFVVVGVMLENDAVRNTPGAKEAGLVLAKQAFKIFDISSTVRSNDVLHKVKTQTAVLIEEATANAAMPVCFAEMTFAFPADKSVDAEGFIQCIEQCSGRGTPFASPNEDIALYMEGDLDDVPWIEKMNFKTWNLWNPLAQCGFIVNNSRRSG